MENVKLSQAEIDHLLLVIPEATAELIIEHGCDLSKLHMPYNLMNKLFSKVKAVDPEQYHERA